MINRFRSKCFIVGFVFLGLAAVITIGVLNFSNEFIENDGCTSWVATGDATGGVSLLHKNRDKGLGDKQNDKQIVVRGKGEYAWVGIKNFNDTNPSAGINDEGLAVAYNFVTGYCFWGTSERKILKNILNNCAVVGDANGGAIKHLLDISYFRNAGIYFLADKYKVAIVEVEEGAGDREYTIILNEEDNGGALGRANHFSQISPDRSSLHSEIRHDKINFYLNQKKSNITALDCFKWSRRRYSNNHYTGCICNDDTAAATTFVIDENPCMWVAIGRPDNSIYVPVHIDANKTGDNISDRLKEEDDTIWKKSMNLYNKDWGTDEGAALRYGCLSNYFLAYESGMLKENPLDTDDYDSLAVFDNDMAEYAFQVLDDLDEITECISLETYVSFTTKFNDGFEGGVGNWDGDWDQSDAVHMGGNFSAEANKSNDGLFKINNENNVSTIIESENVQYALVHFYLRQHYTDDEDICLTYYKDGEEYVVEDLYTQDDFEWHEYEFLIVDDYYLDISNFRVGFNAPELSNWGFYYEKVYVDDVQIKVSSESLFDELTQ